MATGYHHTKNLDTALSGLKTDLDKFIFSSNALKVMLTNTDGTPITPSVDAFRIVTAVKNQPMDATGVIYSYTVPAGEETSYTNVFLNKITGTTRQLKIEVNDGANDIVVVKSSAGDINTSAPGRAKAGHTVKITVTVAGAAGDKDDIYIISSRFKPVPLFV